MSFWFSNEHHCKQDMGMLQGIQMCFAWNPSCKGMEWLYYVLLDKPVGLSKLASSASRTLHGQPCLNFLDVMQYLFKILKLYPFTLSRSHICSSHFFSWAQNVSAAFTSNVELNKSNLFFYLVPLSLHLKDDRDERWRHARILEQPTNKQGDNQNEKYTWQP